MERYGNVSGDSGVRAYEILPDGIEVQFLSGEIYFYTVASAGRTHIQRMKRLALQGQGLSTYISQHVKHRYASKAWPPEPKLPSDRSRYS
jgi:hypothetical protein